MPKSMSLGFLVSSGVCRVSLRGVSKSHKFKGLVKVGASKGVIRVDLKKIMVGGGGFPGNQKTPLDTPLVRATQSAQTLVDIVFNHC